MRKPAVRATLAAFAGLVLAAVLPVASVAGTVFATPQTICTITDPDLPEISGALATRSGFLVANDSGASVVELDEDCAVVSATELDGVQPVDVEDLARGPDGTVWLADIGGNLEPRSGVAFYGLRPDGDVVTARFRYPNGTHDAEAAFVTMDNEVVLVTKERGAGTVYRARLPGGDLATPVPLRDVGELDLPAIGAREDDEGSLLVTGAALSPDGRHVSLRTYTDAYEWEITDGDPAATLVSTAPRRVGGLDQPQGEAITYSWDGLRLVAFSEQLGSPVLSVDISRSAPSAEADRLTLPAWSLLVAIVPALLLVAGLANRYFRGRAANAG
jgi:hypothetical protein